MLPVVGARPRPRRRRSSRACPRGPGGGRCPSGSGGSPRPRSRSAGCRTSAPGSTSASSTPSSRAPSTIGWPWGQVFASPIAASIRSSSTGDIACSSRSASSWTSSQGIPRTSVRKRSISRWRRTIASASLAAPVGEGERLVVGPLDVAVALEPADHLVDGRRRELHRPGDVRAVDRQPGLLEPEHVWRYSSSATVALAMRLMPTGTGRAASRASGAGPRGGRPTRRSPSGSSGPPRRAAAGAACSGSPGRPARS